MPAMPRTATPAMLSLIAALSVATPFVWAVPVAAETDTSSRQVVAENAAASEIAFEDIIAKVKAAGYPEILRIDHESDRYEIKARNPQGVILEVYIDPASGEFVLDPNTGKPLTKTVGRSFKADPQVALDGIIAQVKAAGYAEVYAIEQEHALYEVKVRDVQGRRFELYVHPQTGELLKHPKTGKPLVQDLGD